MSVIARCGMLARSSACIPQPDSTMHGEAVTFSQRHLSQQIQIL
jgi:hypothetical protein